MSDREPYNWQHRLKEWRPRQVSFTDLLEDPQHPGTFSSLCITPERRVGVTRRMLRRMLPCCYPLQDSEDKYAYCGQRDEKRTLKKKEGDKIPEKSYEDRSLGENRDQRKKMEDSSEKICRKRRRQRKSSSKVQAGRKRVNKSRHVPFIPVPHDQWRPLPPLPWEVRAKSKDTHQPISKKNRSQVKEEPVVRRVEIHSPKYQPTRARFRRRCENRFRLRDIRDHQMKMRFILRDVAKKRRMEAIANKTSSGNEQVSSSQTQHQANKRGTDTTASSMPSMHAIIQTVSQSERATRQNLERLELSMCRQHEILITISKLLSQGLTHNSLTEEYGLEYQAVPRITAAEEVTEANIDRSTRRFLKNRTFKAKKSTTVESSSTTSGPNSSSQTNSKSKHRRTDTPAARLSSKNQDLEAVAKISKKKQRCRSEAASRRHRVQATQENIGIATDVTRRHSSRKQHQVEMAFRTEDISEESLSPSVHVLSEDADSSSDLSLIEHESLLEVRSTSLQGGRRVPKRYHVASRTKILDVTSSPSLGEDTIIVASSSSSSDKCVPVQIIENRRKKPLCVKTRAVQRSHQLLIDTKGETLNNKTEEIQKTSPARTKQKEGSRIMKGGACKREKNRKTFTQQAKTTAYSVEIKPPKDECQFNVAPLTTTVVDKHSASVKAERQERRRRKQESLVAKEMCLTKETAEAGFNSERKRRTKKLEKIQSISSSNNDGKAFHVDESNDPVAAVVEREKPNCRDEKRQRVNKETSSISERQRKTIKAAEKYPTPSTRPTDYDIPGTDTATKKTTTKCKNKGRQKKVQEADPIPEGKHRTTQKSITFQSSSENEHELCLTGNETVAVFPEEDKSKHREEERQQMRNDRRKKISQDPSEKFESLATASQETSDVPSAYQIEALSESPKDRENHRRRVKKTKDLTKQRTNVVAQPLDELEARCVASSKKGKGGSEFIFQSQDKVQSGKELLGESESFNKANSLPSSAEIPSEECKSTRRVHRTRQTSNKPNVTGQQEFSSSASSMKTQRSRANVPQTDVTSVTETTGEGKFAARKVDEIQHDMYTEIDRSSIESVSIRTEKKIQKQEQHHSDADGVAMVREMFKFKGSSSKINKEVNQDGCDNKRGTTGKKTKIQGLQDVATESVEKKEDATICTSTNLKERRKRKTKKNDGLKLDSSQQQQSAVSEIQTEAPLLAWSLSKEKKKSSKERNSDDNQLKKQKRKKPSATVKQSNKADDEADITSCAPKRHDQIEIPTEQIRVVNATKKAEDNWTQVKSELRKADPLNKSKVEENIAMKTIVTRQAFGPTDIKALTRDPSSKLPSPGLAMEQLSSEDEFDDFCRHMSSNSKWAIRDRKKEVEIKMGERQQKKIDLVGGAATDTEPTLRPDIAHHNKEERTSEDTTRKEGENGHFEDDRVETPSDESTPAGSEIKSSATAKRSSLWKKITKNPALLKKKHRKTTDEPRPECIADTSSDNATYKSAKKDTEEDNRRGGDIDCLDDTPKAKSNRSHKKGKHMTSWKKFRKAQGLYINKKQKKQSASSNEMEATSASPDAMANNENETYEQTNKNNNVEGQDEKAQGKMDKERKMQKNEGEKKEKEEKKEKKEEKNDEKKKQKEEKKKESDEIKKEKKEKKEKQKEEKQEKKKKTKKTKEEKKKEKKEKLKEKGEKKENKKEEKMEKKKQKKEYKKAKKLMKGDDGEITDDTKSTPDNQMKKKRKGLGKLLKGKKVKQMQKSEPNPQPSEVETPVAQPVIARCRTVASVPSTNIKHDLRFPAALAHGDCDARPTKQEASGNTTSITGSTTIEEKQGRLEMEATDVAVGWCEAVKPNMHKETGVKRTLASQTTAKHVRFAKATGTNDLQDETKQSELTRFQSEPTEDSNEWYDSDGDTIATGRKETKLTKSKSASFSERKERRDDKGGTERPIFPNKQSLDNHDDRGSYARLSRQRQRNQIMQEILEDLSSPDEKPFEPDKAQDFLKDDTEFKTRVISPENVQVPSEPCWLDTREEHPQVDQGVDTSAEGGAPEDSSPTSLPEITSDKDRGVTMQNTQPCQIGTTATLNIKEETAARIMKLSCDDIAPTSAKEIAVGAAIEDIERSDSRDDDEDKGGEKDKEVEVKKEVCKPLSASKEMETDNNSWDEESDLEEVDKNMMDDLLRDLSPSDDEIGGLDGRMSRSAFQETEFVMEEDEETGTATQPTKKTSESTVDPVPPNSKLDACVDSSISKKMLEVLEEQEDHKEQDLTELDAIEQMLQQSSSDDLFGILDKMPRCKISRPTPESKKATSSVKPETEPVESPKEKMGSVNKHEENDQALETETETVSSTNDILAKPEEISRSKLLTSESPTTVSAKKEETKAMDSPQTVLKSKANDEKSTPALEAETTDKPSPPEEKSFVIPSHVLEHATEPSKPDNTGEVTRKRRITFSDVPCGPTTSGQRRRPPKGILKQRPVQFFPNRKEAKADHTYDVVNRNALSELADIKSRQAIEFSNFKEEERLGSYATNKAEGQSWRTEIYPKEADHCPSKTNEKTQNHEQSPPESESEDSSTTTIDLDVDMDDIKWSDAFSLDEETDVFPLKKAGTSRDDTRSSYLESSSESDEAPISPVPHDQDVEEKKLSQSLLDVETDVFPPKKAKTASDDIRSPSLESSSESDEALSSPVLDTTTEEMKPSTNLLDERIQNRLRDSLIRAGKPYSASAFQEAEIPPYLSNDFSLAPEQKPFKRWNPETAKQKLKKITQSKKKLPESPTPRWLKTDFSPDGTAPTREVWKAPKSKPLLCSTPEGTAGDSDFDYASMTTQEREQRRKQIEGESKRILDSMRSQEKFQQSPKTARTPPPPTPSQDAKDLPRFLRADFNPTPDQKPFKRWDPTQAKEKFTKIANKVKLSGDSKKKASPVSGAPSSADTPRWLQPDFDPSKADPLTTGPPPNQFYQAPPPQTNEMPQYQSEPQILETNPAMMDYQIPPHEPVFGEGFRAAMADPYAQSQAITSYGSDIVDHAAPDWMQQVYDCPAPEQHHPLSHAERSLLQQQATEQTEVVALGSAGVPAWLQNQPVPPRPALEHMSALPGVKPKTTLPLHHRARQTDEQTHGVKAKGLQPTTPPSLVPERIPRNAFTPKWMQPGLDPTLPQAARPNHRPPPNLPSDVQVLGSPGKPSWPERGTPPAPKGTLKKMPALPGVQTSNRRAKRRETETVGTIPSDLTTVVPIAARSRPTVPLQGGFQSRFGHANLSNNAQSNVATKPMPADGLESTNDRRKLLNSIAKTQATRGPRNM